MEEFYWQSMGGKEKMSRQFKKTNFIMRPGKNAYEITVEHEGYKPYKLSVDLPLGAHEVATTIKPIVPEMAQ